jgi:serine/threonine protein phosphatase PrpC
VPSQPDPTLGYSTDKGRGCEVNQDKLGFYRPDDQRLIDIAGSIYVVADGMGSSDRGAALADQAIRVLVRAYYAAVEEHGRSDALAVALSACDRVLARELAARPDGKAAGATVVAAVVWRDELIAGNVGDARAYLVREGQAYRLSESAEGAILGGGGVAQPFVTDAIPLGHGDRVVLASDGLHQLVPDDRIAEIAGRSAPQEAAEKLVATANARGGWDNITAVVVAPFATVTRAAAAPPARSEVPWVPIALGSALVLLVAAVVLLRPWQWLQPPALLGSGEPTPAVAPAVVPATLVAVAATATPPPSSTPTEAATEDPRTSVPDVLLETLENARMALETMRLDVDVVRLWSDDVDAGRVMKQEPEAGALVEPGTVVTIYVSLGSAPPPTATRTRVPPTAADTATSTVAPSPTAVPTEAPPQEEPDRDPGGNKPKPPPPTSPPPTDKPEAPTPKPPPPTAPGGGFLGGRPRGLSAPLPGPRYGTARIWRLLVAGLDDVRRARSGAERAVALNLAPPAVLQITATVTATATVSPTGTITPTATITPTNTPTFTPTPTATNTATATSTPTPTSTPTNTPTPTPAPAYLPLSANGHWLLCMEPWQPYDDPETNDSPQASAVAIPKGLCRAIAYTGHLWRYDGRIDRQDWMRFAAGPGAVRVVLEVPADRSIDYDLAVYRQTPGGMEQLGVSQEPPGAGEEVFLAERASGTYWVQVYSPAFPGEEPPQIEPPYRLVWDQR